MSYLINQFRSAQARDDLIKMLEKQLEYRKNLLAKVKEFVLLII